MNLMDVAKKWIVPLCIAAILMLFLSWSYVGSDKHVVSMPAVTEESLSPEQKALLEQNRKLQADVMVRVGADPNHIISPEEFARQRMEEVKAEQTNGAGTPADQNTGR